MRSAKPQETGTFTAQPRALSKVLLKITLFLALVLGLFAALIQLSLDLQQQKNAVEDSAEAFLDSITPSAASAVYNFYNEAADQAVAGLFTQRAIRYVQILNGSEVMVERGRVLTPTLPTVALIAKSDEVLLTRELRNPELDSGEVIGELTIIVDRSIVPPAIVRRMVSFFLLSTVKNLLFGLALVALVYAALTRHIIQIAEATSRWKPGAGALTIPKPPGFLRNTEVELLGDRIVAMSGTAETAIHELEDASREVRKNNSELSQRSSQLSKAVKARTQELHTANLALKHQADCDALTGLTNRGAFDRFAIRSVKDAAEDHASVALIMIDLDQFKPFNDHYGHQAGDSCLVSVASVLSDLGDDNETLVARYGGEEFICLIRNGGRQKGEDFAEQVHKALAELAVPHDRSSVSDVVTASIGIAWEKCGRSTTLETLTSAADEALYEAKHKGRNRTIFSTEKIRERVRKRRKIVTDLLEAIELRQFEPFFQSQVDANTGEIVGMEALARWCKPNGQVLSPQEFMPTAEENDLVRIIDGIIFDKCALFLREAQELGFHVPRMSVNLSEDHLKDDALIDRLRNLCDGVTTPIAVELLETTALDSPSPKLAWTIDNIRDLGMEVEIDDFGTGKTSIVSLMTMRPSRLKIARELVIPAPLQDRNKRLLSCVLEIGNTLGIDIVAEGVETQEHRKLLLDMGCTIHQGFLYSRPVKASEQMKQLSDHKNQKNVS
ncbi:bifunctional diguanylate cyclase/phosphodiesterase [uncultured Roseovarius sp.]|uniref:putative bifunctional diguanylate cyclase/phosphodiesterase n=1 Tax=uncultured Roseovarius sp. TaxID=293344 RepID=UPI002606E81D|nr:bifunctional diguanylate cyclase/phosphodiesterase [uncultured Roseovarius sp.]